MVSIKLLARGLTNVERFDDGLLTVTHLTRDDYERSGADESFSEGVVDHLRSVEGTAVAGLVREQFGDPSTRKVSLRATEFWTRTLWPWLRGPARLYVDWLRRRLRRSADERA